MGSSRSVRLGDFFFSCQKNEIVGSGPHRSYVAKLYSGKAVNNKLVFQKCVCLHKLESYF